MTKLSNEKAYAAKTASAILANSDCSIQEFIEFTEFTGSTETEDYLMTTAQVCKFLNISKPTLLRLAKSGHLKRINLTGENGRNKRFWRSEIDKYCEKV